MNKKAQYTIVAGLIGAWTLLTFWTALAQDTPAPSVTVTLEKNTITQHEPVIMRFTFLNPSSQDIAVDLGYDFEEVDVKVTDTDGRVWRRPHLTAREVRERISQGLFVPPGSILTFPAVIYAAPGATGVTSIVLNDWVDFDKVGIYRITVAASRLSTSPPGSIEIKETSLMLTVIPRNEVSLATACAGLITRLMDWKSAEDSETAAKALSKVNDPVAVPFLAQALKQKSFATMMVAALARLNTPDAVIALESASRSSDKETRDAARNALTVLHKTRPLG